MTYIDSTSTITLCVLLGQIPMHVWSGQRKVSPQFNLFPMGFTMISTGCARLTTDGQPTWSFEGTQQPQLSRHPSADHIGAPDALEKNKASNGFS